MAIRWWALSATAGGVQSSNALGNQIRRILNDDSSQGPALAQRRAEQIAEALGGKVVKLPSAQSQSQWEARPPVKWKIDYAQMHRHGHTLPTHLPAYFSSREEAAEALAKALYPSEFEGELNKL